MNRTDILETAISLTNGARDNTYGDPFANHTKLAALITAFLGFQISPMQAAVILVLVKIARMSVSPLHNDNYVDAAAYVAIAGECANRSASIGK